MCLIVVAIDQHPNFPLLAVANRDEFFQRPTAPSHFWGDHPEILAGRDLEADGTWMGVTRQGRWAAVTNVRDPTETVPSPKSRGNLAKDFLSSTQSLGSFLEQCHETRSQYRGYNLLVGEGSKTAYYSNRQGIITQLSAGIHGLSNAFLNTPWPKVERLKAEVADWFEQRERFGKLRKRDEEPVAEKRPESLFQALERTDCFPDAELPQTGVPLEWERALSATMIRSPLYGTRSSTLLWFEPQAPDLFQIQWREHIHQAEQIRTGSRHFSFLMQKDGHEEV